MVGHDHHDITVADKLPTPAGDNLATYGACQFPNTGVASVRCEANGTWIVDGVCAHMHVCDDMRFCRCKEDLGTLTCHERGATAIPPPSSIPSWARVIYLGGNKIRRVPGRAFSGLGLTSIDLSYNLITEIAPDAFAGVNDLGFLSFHANNLTSLPDNMLRPVGQLFSISASFTLLTRLSRAFFAPVPKLSAL